MAPNRSWSQKLHSHPCCHQSTSIGLQALDYLGEWICTAHGYSKICMDYIDTSNLYKNCVATLIPG